MKEKQKQSSTLENLPAIRFSGFFFFYRFIHQRSISIHYKNSNIVNIDALGGLIESIQMHSLQRGNEEPLCAPR